MISKKGLPCNFAMMFHCGSCCQAVCLNFTLYTTCVLAVRHADLAWQAEVYLEVASESWSVLGPAAGHVIYFQRWLSHPELAPQHQTPDSTPHEEAIAGRVLPCANQHLHVRTQ